MFYVYLGNDLLYEPLDQELVIFNPKLTLEMGKAGSLEFDIPPANPFYTSLAQLSSTVVIKMDNDELFRGRVLSNERVFNNVRHVYCEGILAYLVDSVQKTEKYNGTTRALFTKLINGHNARVEASKKFTVGSVTIDDRSIILEGQSDDINVGDIDYKQIAINSIVGEWNNTYESIENCIIDHVGGYLRARHQNGVNYIDFVKEYGGVATQEIELGSNLLDLTEEISAEDLFTVLVPLGDDNLTIASVNGGSDELVDTNAVSRYGRIVRTHVFNNVNTASTLLENARRYLASNVNIPRTVTISAVDLHMVDKMISAIGIGDRVHISSPPHNMDEHLVCTKIEYDLMNPAGTKYTFGNPKQTLTERYKEDKRKQNDTFGNSSGGHGGGGGGGGKAAEAAEAVAEAAAEVAEEETKRQIGYFYDQYIDLDATDDGKMTLGAMFKYWTGAKEVLLNQVGIDLDASTGNINIRSLKNMVDSNLSEIGKQSARIDILQTDTQVAIESATERIETLEGVTSNHSTLIQQVSSDANAQINLVAQAVNAEKEERTASYGQIKILVDDNKAQITQAVSKINTNTANIASITSRVTNTESNITLAARSISNLQDGLSGANTKIASIELKANANESSIKLKADKTYVDSEILTVTGKIEAEAANFKNLTSGVASATILKANMINAVGTLLVGGKTVLPAAHYHSLSADNSGKVTMGTGQTDGPTSFNIADTKFYKDGVSAAKTAAAQTAKLQSLGVGAAGSPYEYNSVKYADVTVTTKVVATKGDGTLYTKEDSLTKAVNVGAVYSAAHDAGAASVTLNDIGAVWGGSNNRVLTVTASTSGGARKTRDIDCNSIYNAGASGVDVGYSDGSYNIWIQNTYRLSDGSYEPYAVQVGVNLTNGVTRYSNMLYF